MSIRAFIPFALSISLAAGTAFADQHDEIASAQILPGWRADNGNHFAALRIRLAPGWKTYWRTPGDAGIPPQFNWSRSENVDGISVSFPVPDVFDQNGFRTIGYEDQVIFPLRIQAQDHGTDALLSGDLIIGVCEEICVPFDIKIEAILPGSASKRSPIVAAAFRDRPQTAKEAGVSSVKCDIHPISDGMKVTATVEMPNIQNVEAAVIELADRSIWVSEPDILRDGQSLIAISDLVPQDAQPFAVARSDIRITVFSAGAAVDIRGCS